MQDISMTSTITDGEAIFENVVTYLLSPIFQLIVAIAVVYFFYGVVMFLLSFNKTGGGDGESMSKEQGKKHLMYGLLGLIIIFSINGILIIINELVGGLFQY